MNPTLQELVRLYCGDGVHLFTVKDGHVKYERIIEMLVPFRVDLVPDKTVRIFLFERPNHLSQTR